MLVTIQCLSLWRHNVAMVIRDIPRYKMFTYMCNFQVLTWLPVQILMVCITQPQLWKSRHEHHDDEDNITIVLTITKIAQP